MGTILIFSLPSVSVHRTLSPLAESLVSAGYTVVYYNTATFLLSFSTRCKSVAYPPYENGYDTNSLARETTFFDFAGLLLNTTDSIFEFLISEKEIRKPDLVIHSHLAMWGKMLARKFELRSITVFTTFVLLPEIMLDFFRKSKKKNNSSAYGETRKALELHRKYKQFYTKSGLKGIPDVWDAYINKGDLNLCFILQEFQPQRDKLGEEFKFIGYPFKEQTTNKKRNIVYISLGTIFNDDPGLLKLCISVMEKRKQPCVIATGTKINTGHFNEVPNYIQLVEFTDQSALLQESILFITRGGMASVHEALFAAVPMIVIPEIPEQVLIAEMIDNEGAGIHLPSHELTPFLLEEAIEQILEKECQTFTSTVKCFSQIMQPGAATDTAIQLVTTFLN